jgi:hypothetical protein
LNTGIAASSLQYTERNELLLVTEKVYAELLGWVALWWRYPVGMEALMRVRQQT